MIDRSPTARTLSGTERTGAAKVAESSFGTLRTWNGEQIWVGEKLADSTDNFPAKRWSVAATESCKLVRYFDRSGRSIEWQIPKAKVTFAAMKPRLLPS